MESSFPNITSAETQSTEQEEAERTAMDHAFSDYNDAFGRGDLSAIGQHCNVPFVVILPQEVRVLPTAADVEKFYGAARQDLKERGYSHSKLLEVNVRPFLQDAKLTVLSWRRCLENSCDNRSSCKGCYSS